METAFSIVWEAEIPVIQLSGRIAVCKKKNELDSMDIRYYRLGQICCWELILEVTCPTKHSNFGIPHVIDALTRMVSGVQFEGYMIVP